MNLVTPNRIRNLQRALYAKAKGSFDYRFYTLYDKVYREDILLHAYRCSRANGGVPGADGQTFEEIESYGVERWLDELAQTLRNKTYRAGPIERRYIPKPNGGQRPLGIATIRDRVVQTAAMLVLEPIFEADLLPEQHAYRPKRSALDAVQQVHQLLCTGHTEVIDADLSGYFDAIPHAELMTSLARRVSDSTLLALIKQWLIAPVEESGHRGRVQRTTPNKDQRRGIPQGSPISPLLSNVYMRRFILGWKTLGYERRFRAHIVNYADDYVICCKGSAQPVMEAMRAMMNQLKLTVNEDKTRQCRIPRDRVEFLGYTIGRYYSPQTGRAYIGSRPSKKSVQRLCRAISDCTDRRWLWMDADIQVKRINRKLNGWANYFRLGSTSQAYKTVDRHTRRRLRRWLCKKHKQGGKGVARYSEQELDRMGLIRLIGRPRSFPWANA